MAAKKSKKATKKTTKTSGKKAVKATKKATKKLVAKPATKKAATKKTATKKAAPKKVATKKITAKTATKKMTAPKATNKMSKAVDAGNSMAAHNQAPKIGEAIPDFEVQATGGQRVTLQGLRGKNVVLYFYPKDATPGCTIEGHEFTKLHEQFKALGTEVYGVSRDDLNSHEKFKTKECYSIDLLSDTDSELCNMFDVIKMKNMYGKQVRGIERSTFVIDQDGRLVKEWRGVSVPGHADEVLSYVKTL